MRKHQPQQETESLVCPEREVMGASEAGGMEHEQLYGNQAAQAALGEEPIDIDVIDRAPGFADEMAAAVFGDDTQLDVRGGLEVMVAEVIARAGGRPIRRLSIYGHASPGSLSMGPDRVNPTMDPALLAPLLALAPLFSEDGHVEIHGCSFGAGEAGEQMLYVFHQYLGVPVSAGVVPQTALFDGFEGTTVTAKTDEEGYPVFEREEDVVGDLIHGAGGALGELVWSAADLGEEALKAIADAGAGALESAELPEVGDLTEWLFGA